MDPFNGPHSRCVNLTRASRFPRHNHMSATVVETHKVSADSRESTCKVYAVKLGRLRAISVIRSPFSACRAYAICCSPFPSSVILLRMKVFSC